MTMSLYTIEHVRKVKKLLQYRDLWSEVQLVQNEGDTNIRRVIGSIQILYKKYFEDTPGNQLVCNSRRWTF